MSTRTYTYTFTAAQCHLLACACEIEAQTLQEVSREGGKAAEAAAKWAAMLRELQVLLDVADVFGGVDCSARTAHGAASEMGGQP